MTNGLGTITNTDHQTPFDSGVVDKFGNVLADEAAVMTISIEDIPAALVDIHTKLAEKLGGQPYLPPELTCRQNGNWCVTLWSGKSNILHSIDCDRPTEAIQKALDSIAGMVSKEEQRVIDWQKDVAKVIDDGHDLNLPDSVMAPLRASSQAMTENLLTVAK
jgi:hypothetical protein